jgi:light-regulated signal transduction histidine kinase (bacteriophytochrome)
VLRKLNLELERRVKERTAQLEALNKELESFSYSVSHDLRAPLRSIDGFCRALIEDYSHLLDDEGKRYLNRMLTSTQRMSDLINDILALSRLTRGDLHRVQFNLSQVVQDICQEYQEAQPERQVKLIIAPNGEVNGDKNLLDAAIRNLLSNAWKFTAKHATACIEFGIMEKNGEKIYYIRDDGAGFDMAYADKLFGAFQRLHTHDEFDGSGIGLATVQRIINRHGGRIWAEAEVEKGAIFYFILP